MKSRLRNKILAFWSEILWQKIAYKLETACITITNLDILMLNRKAKYALNFHSDRNYKQWLLLLIFQTWGLRVLFMVDTVEAASVEEIYPKYEEKLFKCQLKLVVHACNLCILCGWVRKTAGLSLAWAV